MKTKKEITELNFNDYAFFRGVSTSDAKQEFIKHLFPSDWLSQHEISLKRGLKSQYLTDALSPKISIKDKVEKKLLDFKMKSNSALDGMDQLEYLCDIYNKGIPLNTLREFSENKTFVKSISFTGKFSIIEQILNPEQLIKLRKTWVLTHPQESGYSDRLIQFEMNNNWVEKHMIDNGIDMVRYNKSKDSYIERKSKKSA